jgi:hypothetical protein
MLTRYKGDNCRREGFICSDSGIPTPEQKPAPIPSMSETQSSNQFADPENLAPLQASVDDDNKRNADPGLFWLSELLAICNCDSVPKILLSRALNPTKDWDSNGDPSVSFLSLNTLYPNSTFKFYDMVTSHSDFWLQRYTSNPGGRSRLCRFVPPPIIMSKYTMLRKPLDLLIAMILALPEPRREIAWEAIEDELWEVLESTCLPLLGVITLEELKKYLSRNLR